MLNDILGNSGVGFGHISGDEKIDLLTNRFLCMKIFMNFQKFYFETNNIAGWITTSSMIWISEINFQNFDSIEHIKVKTPVQKFERNTWFIHFNGVSTLSILATFPKSNKWGILSWLGKRPYRTDKTTEVGFRPSVKCLPGYFLWSIIATMTSLVLIKLL